MSFDAALVRRRLKGRPVEFFEIIDSTMREASAMAMQGCAAGTIVVAEEQTAGQGRHGHSWHSAPGCGLYCSLVLGAQTATPAVTMALGLAAAEAIARVTDLACDLRWPNDLLLNGRKTAGILVQVEGAALIAGIGVNVNHVVFPEELRSLATSLRMESGREHSREDLLVELIEASDRYLRMLEQAGKQKIFELFALHSSYASGKRVTVDLPEGRVRGVTSGLNSEGFLRVTTESGREELIIAGGVRAAGH
ncbi:MAG: biotin--[acetyl-CoA-carboxylase] ligase [Bryobacteraceae bacterium]